MMVNKKPTHTTHQGGGQHSTARPSQNSTARPAQHPASRPAPHSTARPAQHPASRPATHSTAHQAQHPVARPAQHTALQQTSQLGARAPKGKHGRGPKRYSAGRNVPPIKADTKQYISHVGTGEKKLKIIVLGGCEEVGRNCTIFEYDNDIIIVDLGLQFPEEDMPGIDYIIPNMTYLKERKKDIRGVIITHAHYDHIGGIPHVMADLGNPILYTGKLTKGIIERRQTDFPNSPKLKFIAIDDKSKLKLGKFDVEFFHVNHNITNSLGVYIKTPTATAVHTGDFKFDDTPINDKPTDYDRLKELGRMGVDILLADSTNAASEGRQISEYKVTTELDKIFTETKGRLIVGTFASNLNRIQQCVSLAEKYGRKVILAGRSINSNVEIAHELNYFDVNTKHIIEAEEYVKNRDKYPNDKVIIIGTGAQGERNAFMMRYVNDEHRFFRVESGDTTVFSSSVIPGNERTVSNLKDALARKGCNIIHYAMMDVHAGGHAKQEDLKQLIDMMHPTYYIPIEQSYYYLSINRNMAIAHGHPADKSFVPTNGQVMTFERKGGKVEGKLHDQYIPSDYVFVDGLGVGDISNVVLRDRLIMAQDGMVVIIATIEHKTGKLLGNPDIISRGFVYMKENKHLIEETRDKVKRICTDTDKLTPAFDDDIKNKVRDEVGEYLFSKTKRRPMILPVVIKV